MEKIMIDNEVLLAKAIAIAAAAHAGQVDKAGMPYIFHPLRVMMKLNDPVDQMVAVLHDVIEDCPDWTFDRLAAEGFGPDVIAALDCVTKRENEPYDQAIGRAADNPIARRVKVQDLLDNMDIRRIPNPIDQDYDRVRKYAAALQSLLA
jgi:GTP diphosphokinase / guanosine-3',5'-bis(diphosphate) 3'-diphosphatase